MYTRRRRYQRKTRRPFRWLGILLLVIGLPIGLELLTRVAANTTDFGKQLGDDPSANRAQAYQLRFVSKSGESYVGMPDNGKLLATRNALLGYRLAPKQQNSFWTINEQGFRDEEPVPLQKPAGEVRIVVLGGSTAFGELSSNNQATFSSKLEAKLNQQVAQQRSNPDRFQPSVLPYRADQVDQALARPPRIRDGKYRVINAAVPGYASGNELAMLVQQIGAYNPDIILVLGGYDDLLLPSSEMGTDLPNLENLLEGKQESVSKQLGEQFQTWFNQLYLVRGFRYYALQGQQEEKVVTPPNVFVEGGSLSNSLASNSDELDRRIYRYRYHLSQMVQWASASQKRLIVGLQPEITGRQEDKLSSAEADILADLGNTYTERVQAGYQKLQAEANQVIKSSANARLVDLYQLYNNFNEQAFLSPIGLTDNANTVLADRFYQAIAAELAIEPKPFGSP